MTFSVKPTINVGDDSLEILNSLDVNKIFFVTDPFVVESRMIDQVTRLLDRNISYDIFSEIKPDPSQELVEEGKKALKASNPDLICAIGGGSAIDATKAIIYDIYNEEKTKKTFVTQDMT